MKITSRIKCAALILACSCAAPDAASAQDNPLSAHNRLMYAGLKLWLVASAEKMPEEHYSSKPTADVRSFGQIIGHVADGQYRFCSIVRGERNPTPNVEKTKTSKPDLIAALKDAIAYCDKAYDTMTDATALEMVKIGPGMPRLGVLTVNNLHTTLHYGNLVTYMRLKSVVPPSSDPTMQPQPPKK